MAERAIAYNQLTPIQEDFGNNLTQAENQGFRYRREQRLIDELDRKRRKDFEDKYAINPDDYFLESTEFRTVNDVGREAIHQIRDRMFEIKGRLNKNPNNLELQKQWDKLSYSIKALKDGHAKFKDIGTNYLELVEDDAISGLDEDVWRGRLEAYDEGRLKVMLDKDNNLNYQFFDKDGKFVEDVNYKDLIQGSLRRRIDINQEAKDFLVGIGATKLDQNTGGFVKTINEWGSRQDAQATQLTNAYLENPDILDDVLYQAGLGADDIEVLPDDQKKRIASDYLKGVIRGAYDEATSLKPFNRPVGRRSSFTETQKMNAASNLFDLSMRASSGERGALDQMVGSRIKVQDEESDRTVEKTIGDYAITEEGTVFLDGNGNQIATIPNDSDIRRRAFQFAMMIENGQSADNVQSTFELGEGLNQGRFTIGETAPTKISREVSALDLSNIEQIPSDETSAVAFLRGQFGESGYRFKEALIGRNAVKITAPNGEQERFFTSDVEAIKEFIDRTSERKTIFVNEGDSPQVRAQKLIQKYSSGGSLLDELDKGFNNTTNQNARQVFDSIVDAN